MVSGFGFDLDISSLTCIFSTRKHIASGFGFNFDISLRTCVCSEPHLLEVTLPHLRSGNLHIHTFTKISLHRIPKRVVKIIYGLGRRFALRSSIPKFLPLRTPSPRSDDATATTGEPSNLHIRKEISVSNSKAR